MICGRESSPRPASLSPSLSLRHGGSPLEPGACGGAAGVRVRRRRFRGPPRYSRNEPTASRRTSKTYACEFSKKKKATTKTQAGAAQSSPMLPAVSLGAGESLRGSKPVCNFNREKKVCAPRSGRSTSRPGSGGTYTAHTPARPGPATGWLDLGLLASCRNANQRNRAVHLLTNSQ